MFGWFKCRKDAELHAKLDKLARDGESHHRNLKEIIMGMKEDFEAAFARVDAATTAIATLIRTLVEKLAAGGMTAEEEAAVLAKFGDAATALEAVAATPTDPVPIEPPVA